MPGGRMDPEDRLWRDPEAANGGSANRAIAVPILTQPQPPAPRRRRRATILVIAGVVAALLLGGVGGVLLGRGPAQASPRVVTQTVVRPSPSCLQAVDRADRSLDTASKVEEALHEHTEYMNQLLKGQITPHAALNKGLPSLVTGARESGRFDRALADYHQVVSVCRLQRP